MSASIDVTQLEPGTVLLEKYRVVKTIGVGGMGVVVSCDHLTLGAKVAIKFMLPQLVEKESVVRRFMLEARAATRIKSEHVARVLDVGSLKGEGLPEDGVPFMVMEFLEGKDLSEWVRIGKKFPIAEAVDYTIQACEALAQAHKVGVIHRDIKPANLFLCELDERRVVKVLDFGISKLLDETGEDMSLTKTTTVLGSGLYMSPEQMRSAKNVDFRSDIYSLGVCIYELLAGTQPYTAETFSELCVKVNVDPPTPLRDYRPDVPQELADAIRKAYAKKPADRYKTVQDMAAALAPFAGVPALATHIQGITRLESLMPPPGPSSIPPSIPPPGSSPPSAMAGTQAALTAEPVERNGKGGAGMWIAAAVAALLLSVGGGVLYMRSRAEPTPPVTPAADPEPSASAQPTAEPTAEPTADPSDASGGAGGGGGTGGEGGAGGALANAGGADAADPPPRPTPAGPRPPQPPPPPVKPPPPPPPPKDMAFCPDPDSGLMVPCK